MYALLRRMSLGEHVVFSSADGWTFLFDATGVRRTDKARVGPDDLPRAEVFLPKSRAWSIIDANNDGSPETGKVSNSFLFAILTASPPESRYKEWLKQGVGITLIANPWTVDELHYWCALTSESY